MRNFWHFVALTLALMLYETDPWLSKGTFIHVSSQYKHNIVDIWSTPIGEKVQQSKWREKHS